MPFRRLIVALLVVILLAACSGSSDNTVHVTVTTGMIADAVNMVGGGHVQVKRLMGAGVDPHHYAVTDADQAALTDAQIVFYNGLNLEAGLSGLFGQVSAGKRVVALGEVVPQDKRLNADGVTDPHIWQDVSLWELVVGKIRDELTALDPAHSDDYKTNADAYLAQLNDLDQYIRDQINRIPAERLVLITAHDAFRYFGNAYGMETYAPQNSSAAPPTNESIQSVLQIVVNRQVPAVFVESILPPDNLNIIIAGATAQGQAVEIGGTLYSDAVGQPASNSITYDGMMRHNVDTIVTGLLGLPAE
jgi:manganese/zinc/iron transport system substrate-binding protein